MLRLLEDLHQAPGVPLAEVEAAGRATARIESTCTRVVAPHREDVALGACEGHGEDRAARLLQDLHQVWVASAPGGRDVPGPVARMRQSVEQLGWRWEEFQYFEMSRGHRLNWQRADPGWFMHCLRAAQRQWLLQQVYAVSTRGPSTVSRPG